MNCLMLFRYDQSSSTRNLFLMFSVTYRAFFRDTIPNLILIRTVMASPFRDYLTHWGRVTHICVSKLTIIGSDNGLSPRRCQAIIWTNVGIWLIRPLGITFSEILIGIQTFSFKKMHLQMSSAKCRPSCLGLNVLIEFTKDAFFVTRVHTNGDNVWSVDITYWKRVTNIYVS